jgi:hypothetical protein
MADLTDALLTKIQNHRIDGLELGSDSIHPAYDGLSILNFPSSLCRWFGADSLPHPPLDIPALNDLADGAEQIVVTLVDAVALHRFQRWVNGGSGGLQPLISGGILAALTSIVPSTTCAALTTLWTGRSPAEHGVLGYEIFLREFGLVANMITHEPAAFRGHGGLLYKAGLDPKKFLPVPTIGPRLREADVDVHAFLHYTISGSGLSQMHYPDVSVHTFGGVPDLWVGVRHLAEQPLEKSRLIWTYYGGVDSTSHRYGPDSDQAEAEFNAFIHVLLEEFIGGLTVETRRRTVFILLADHGQLHTRKDPHYELRNHPELIKRLHILPTGENRLAYLYPRPGQVDDVEEYIKRTWPGSFTCAPSSYLLEKGLYGPGKPTGTAPSRLGDRSLISHNDSYLWWSEKDNPLLGRHGGLSAEEMLVPFLAIRLG